MSYFERITIKEQDLTTAGSAVGTDNVVFIPGLMGKIPDGDLTGLYRKRNTAVVLSTTAKGQKETTVNIPYIYSYEKNDGVPRFKPTIKDDDGYSYFYNTLTSKLYKYGDGGYGYISSSNNSGKPVLDNQTVVLNANSSIINNFDGTHIVSKDAEGNNVWLSVYAQTYVVNIDPETMDTVNEVSITLAQSEVSVTLTTDDYVFENGELQIFYPIVSGDTIHISGEKDSASAEITETSTGSDIFVGAVASSELATQFVKAPSDTSNKYALSCVQIKSNSGSSTRTDLYLVAVDSTDTSSMNITVTPNETYIWNIDENQGLLYFVKTVESEDRAYVVTYAEEEGFYLTSEGWRELQESEYKDLYLAQENTPVLCESLSQFYSNFGRVPYKYTVQDNMSIYSYSTAPLDGVVFNDDAIPISGKLFKANDYDTSFVEAVELINLGLPVLYYAMVFRESPDSVDETKEFGYIQSTYSTKRVYQKLDSLFSIDSSTGNANAIIDKGTYNFKYVTTGGFPYLEYYGIMATDGNMSGELASHQRLLEFCRARGDCFAFSDPCNKPNRPVRASDVGSLYYNLNNTDSAFSDDSSSYGAIVYPHYLYSCQATQTFDVDSGLYKLVGSVFMPGSFAYMSALAISLRNNDDWLAIAGVTRGQVPFLQNVYLTNKLTAAIADTYQERDAKVNINAITEVKPYGYVIWGNRTTYNNAKRGNLVASSFLNIRSLVADVKKTVWKACQKCIFEQDTDVLWINFQSMVTPTLDKMVTGQGIKTYKIVKLPTSEKAKLVVRVVLVPIYAIENIEVTVVLTDEDTQIS